MFGTLAPLRSSLRRRGPASGLLDEIEELAGRMWEGRDDGWSFGYNVPTMDVAETDKAVECKLDLPGIKPKEIEIQLNGSVLTVSGERKEEREEKGKTFHRVERRSGTFSRSITLPCPVQEDEVAAEYRDGVLTITLPKTEQAKARRIAVKS